MFFSCTFIKELSDFIYFYQLEIVLQDLILNQYNEKKTIDFEIVIQVYFLDR